MKAKLIGAAAALVFVAAAFTSPARAAPLSLIDQGQTTYDPNTGLVWLDVSLTASLGFDHVQANLLGSSQPYDGFRYATVGEVNQLFADAGITNFSNHGADSHIEALLGLLGTTFLPGPGFAGLGGMTADVLLSDPSYVYVMILMSGTDALSNSFAGLGRTVHKSADFPADSFGSFLVTDAGRTRDAFLVSETPLPAAFPLFATGLGALALLTWQRRRNNRKTASRAVSPKFD